ncbi:MAG: tRNA (cytidine(56)-2'-O)-methyltransferase [Candidatus Hydrothermarchaeales archaeon]
MKVVILRLGHRLLRDKRTTTHVALVARAFGAQGMVMNVDDERIRRSIKKVTKRWGGEFFVEVTKDWRDYVKNWKGKVAHLTMYGIPVEESVKHIRKENCDFLVVVGSEKVPKSIFDLADYNVSITNQPHSEVAALAVFLDRLFEGKELSRDFKGELTVIPSEREKRLAT